MDIVKIGNECNTSLTKSQTEELAENSAKSVAVVDNMKAFIPFLSGETGESDDGTDKNAMAEFVSYLSNEPNDQNQEIDREDSATDNAITEFASTLKEKLGKCRAETVDYADKLKQKYLRKLNEANEMSDFIEIQIQEQEMKNQYAKENEDLCRLEFIEAMKDLEDVDRIQASYDKYQEAVDLITKTREDNIQLSTFIKVQTQKTDFFDEFGGFEGVLSKFGTEIENFVAAQVPELEKEIAEPEAKLLSVLENKFEKRKAELINYAHERKREIRSKFQEENDLVDFYDSQLEQKKRKIENANKGFEKCQLDLLTTVNNLQDVNQIEDSFENFDKSIAIVLQETDNFNQLVKDC